MTCAFFKSLTASAVGFALMVIGGCTGLLGGESAPIRYYVLSEVSRSDAPAPAGAASEAVVSVLDISMSDYLDTQSIVTRPTSNTVDLAQFDQWAAPFGRHVTRTMKNNIAILIPSKRVVLSPLSIPVTVDYELRADVQRFEQDPSGDVVLEARWVLLDLRRRTAVAIEDVAIRKPVAVEPPSEETEQENFSRQKYLAIAASMSSALAELSADIAASIRENARAGS